jgi:hypothetical protein
MAKKKNQTKKHKFKYASSTGSSAASVDSGVLKSSTDAVAAKPTGVSRPPARRGVVQPVAFVRDFSYVGQDLRRIGILAGSLIALELILWFVFGHTSVGASIYRMVQV